MTADRNVRKARVAGPRVLFLCRGGRVRSVAMRYVATDDYGLDALAAGLTNNSRPTLDMLFSWADIVVVCSSNLLVTEVPLEWDRAKIVLCDLGPDRWGSAEHPDLLARCRQLLHDQSWAGGARK